MVGGFYSTSRLSISARDTSLDFLVDRIKHDDEETVRLRLQRFIIEAVSSPIRQQYEAEASLNYQFTENDFYTAEELYEFAERGQPPTRRNELAPIIERIAGQFIQTRMTTTFLGANVPQDDDAAAIAQDYQRHIDQRNHYEFEEQDQAWDGLVGGVGWIKSSIKPNPMGQPTQVDRAVNPFHVYVDPFSTRYDLNEDAKYVVEGNFMDLEDVMALVPDKEDAIREFMQGWTGLEMPYSSAVAASLQNEQLIAGAMYALTVRGNGHRRRVRPFEVWYKRKVRVYYVLTPEGVTAVPVPLDLPTAKAVQAELGSKTVIKQCFQDRMYVGLILGTLVLHHDVSPHRTNLFPYIPFYSGRRKNGGPLPLASRLVPVNESINKRESKSLALLTNRQLLYESGALEDEDEVTTELARPDGVIRVKEGSLSGPGGPRVIIRDNLDIGMAQLQLLQEDKDAIRRVSGQGNEAMGMPSEVRSGTGIARKQMMSNLIVTPLHNNLRRTRFIRARLTFDYMKQYLTEEQTFQLTDDPNAARLVRVTRGHVQALKERVWDIVISDAKDYATLREQQVEMLLTTLPQLAQHGSWMVKLGIQMSELRDKDGLLRMIDEQSRPAPVQPKLSVALSWADLQPEEKAFLSMLMWQNPDLAEAIMQKGDDPAFVQKLKAQLIQTQVKEGTRATVERGKVDVSALQTATEGRMKLREFLQQSQAETPPQATVGQEQEMV